MQIGGVMRVQLVTARPDQTAAEAIRTMLRLRGMVRGRGRRLGSRSASSPSATCCVWQAAARRSERRCCATL